jgi:hypothetical protein
MDATFTGLTVYDRDPFGYVAAQRNTSGTSAWTLPNLFSVCDGADNGNLGAATAGFTGTALANCNPGGLLYAYRSDGYFDGSLTVRGVRTYDGDTQQWSTPDAWQGDAAAPLSGLSYNYADNNPAMYADPSGFYACGKWIMPDGTVYDSHMSCNDNSFNNCIIGCYGPSGSEYVPGVGGNYRDDGFGGRPKQCRQDPGGGWVCDMSDGSKYSPRPMNARADCFFKGGFKDAAWAAGLGTAGAGTYSLRTGTPFSTSMRAVFVDGPAIDVLAITFVAGGIKGYVQGKPGGECDSSPF